MKGDVMEVFELSDSMERLGITRSEVAREAGRSLEALPGDPLVMRKHFSEAKRQTRLRKRGS